MTVGSDAGPAAVLAALDPVPVGPDRFAAPSLTMGLPRVFGGQVLGQSLVAAARTVPSESTAHSMHAYFLRAGDPHEPIEFAVERVRDGRRLQVRTVQALQNGRALTTATISFAGTLPPGVDHQRAVPPTRSPELLPTLQEHAEVFGGLSPSWTGLAAVDCRQADDLLFWQRVLGPVPPDPVLHQALLVFLSDVTTLAVALVPHGVPMGVEEWDGRLWDGVSLDHVIWFHRPVRADEWLLFSHASPSGGHGRALVTGDVFTGDGRLVASIAQEGLLEIRPL
jgi:acyl-CoA thioesterase-2